MSRQTLVYALALAALLFALKWVEAQYFARDLSLEFYVGAIAVMFTLLGVWAGRKITGPRTAKVEPVRVLASLEELGVTTRELEVLRLMAEGHSNQEIADKLFLSINTIKKYTSGLFTKLEVKRRTQAIEKARQVGLIQ